ncbi:hypothetical protein BD413DRAFT_250940 [Trametes elegans]|nr:hypothetical protein BD413DRAFT_250940 [Trametes elegans]
MSSCLSTCVSKAEAASGCSDDQCICTHRDVWASASACVRMSCSAEDATTLNSSYENWCGGPPGTNPPSVVEATSSTVATSVYTLPTPTHSITTSVSIPASSTLNDSPTVSSSDPTSLISSPNQPNTSGSSSSASASDSLSTAHSTSSVVSLPGIPSTSFISVRASVTTTGTGISASYPSFSPTGAYTTAHASSTFLPTSQKSPDSTRSHKPPIPLISALSVVLGLLFAAGAVLFWLRRRRARLTQQRPTPAFLSSYNPKKHPSFDIQSLSLQDALPSVGIQNSPPDALPRRRETLRVIPASKPRSHRHRLPSHSHSFLGVLPRYEGEPAPPVQAQPANVPSPVSSSSRSRQPPDDSNATAVTGNTEHVVVVPWALGQRLLTLLGSSSDGTLVDNARSAEPPPAYEPPDRRCAKAGRRARCGRKTEAVAGLGCVG